MMGYSSIGALFNALPREISHNIVADLGEPVDYEVSKCMIPNLIIYLARGSHVRSAPTGAERRHNAIGILDLNKGRWRVPGAVDLEPMSDPVEAIKEIWRRKRVDGSHQEARHAGASACEVCG